MVCKIDGCQCQKQEIPIHLMYWLTHHGIDIRPLFQKPYIGKKKKPTNINPSNDNNIVTQATYNFVPVENEGNVLEEYLFEMPNLEQEATSSFVQPQATTNNSNVKRSMPYKVPPTRRRV